MTAERRARDAVGAMTLAEKVRVLHGAMPFWRGAAALLIRDLYHRLPFRSGGVPRLGLPGVAFIDGPRGIVLRGGATTFPVPMARGASWNPALEEAVGEAVGKELRSHGGTLFGGVCVNLLRHPGWGRAQETYGEDPVGLAAMGAALVRGVERHGMACVKHFALNSIENARFHLDVTASERVLHELYLPHFKACVDAGASAVMSAYNAVNGEWCGQNEALLRGVLRDRWGFEGFVLTDFVFGVRDAAKALRAGQNLEMPFGMVFGEGIARGVHEGDIDERDVDEAARRILARRLAVPDGDYPPSLRACPEHRALARRVARQSIVLLQNDGLLPLDRGARVAVIGALAATPNLGDRGSSDTRPQSVVTPLQGIRAVASGPDAGDDRIEAERAARGADVAVVVVGLSHREEGEHVVPPDLGPFAELFPPPFFLRPFPAGSRLRRAWARLLRWGAARARRGIERRGLGIGQSFGLGGDRRSLELPPEQVALVRAVVAANPRTVVVVMAGSAVVMEAWRREVPALLMLWYPGMEGGHALADILFGAASPSGRMPFATPTDPAQLPEFDPDARRITYDLWHGQRKLDRDGHPAAFPLGFGLSYASFRTGDLSVEVEGDGLRIRLTVENRSDRDADEVVFVFVAPPGGVERPAEELRAFHRVRVPGGETVAVALDLPIARLGWYDEAAAAFVLEPGLHEVRVGRWAGDPRALRASVSLP